LFRALAVVSAMASLEGTPLDRIDHLLESWLRTPQLLHRYGATIKNRQLVVGPSDGDCLFAAVAATWPDVDANFLRCFCIGNMRALLDTPLPGMSQPFGDACPPYCGNWGQFLLDLQMRSEPSQETMVMLAFITGMAITIVTPGNPVPRVVAVPNPSVKVEWIPGMDNANHIVLEYTGTHYNALVLRDPPTRPIIDAVAMLQNTLPALRGYDGPIGCYHFTNPHWQVAATIEVR
jgi:hypothetical protein